MFPKPVFKIGDKLIINGVEGWFLTAVDYLQCSIISINDGGHWGPPFTVGDPYRVTDAEIHVNGGRIVKA